MGCWLGGAGKRKKRNDEGRSDFNKCKMTIWDGRGAPRARTIRWQLDPYPADQTHKSIGYTQTRVHPWLGYTGADISPTCRGRQVSSRHVFKPAVTKTKVFSTYITGFG
jgi:hypothetical protein